MSSLIHRITTEPNSKIQRIDWRLPEAGVGVGEPQRGPRLYVQRGDHS